MSKGRVEAFSDGVVAILITIMVLELKVPEGAGWDALFPLLSTLWSYVLSFVFLGIYWNNHHHMLHAAQRVNGAILWANLHLLFWLSLVPFVTGWMGHNRGMPVPVAAYGIVMLCAALAYTMLQNAIVALHGSKSTLALAVGSDFKGKVSIGLWAGGIAFAFVHPMLALGIYVLVALIWLIPDRRIEAVLKDYAT